MEACQLTLSLHSKTTIVDYSLIDPNLNICTGIYYCFFGTIIDAEVVLASTGRTLTQNIHWSLVERFVHITDEMMMMMMMTTVMMKSEKNQNKLN